VQRGLTVAPDDLDLRNRCGCVLCTLGRYEAGIAEYEHALALAPDFEPARLNLADAQRVRFA
jgi:Tfp pilus assembly protein PilF